MEQVVVPPSITHPGIVTGSGHHGHHRGLEGKDAVHLHAVQSAGESRDILQSIGGHGLLAMKDRCDQERFLGIEMARTQRELADVRGAMAISQKTVELAIRDDGDRTRDLLRDQHSATLAATLAELKQELLIRRLCPAPTPPAP